MMKLIEVVLLTFAALVALIEVAIPLMLNGPFCPHFRRHQRREVIERELRRVDEDAMVLALKDELQAKQRAIHRAKQEMRDR